MPTHNNCLICSSKNLKPLNGFQKAHLCKCKSCSFVFSKEIPSEQELTNYYENYGRNEYFSPVTVKRYEELLDKMESFRNTNRILDVGCGTGFFLEVAKKRGWEVYGTEHADLAIEICEKKGIIMHKGKLDPSIYKDNFFDVITSFEVLEHINTPIDEISNFSQILRKGGLVYLTTPNFNSLLRFLLKENYNVISYPEHLCYYTPKTLNRLFTQLGYSKLSIQTTGISLTRLKAGKTKTNLYALTPTTKDETLRNQIESKAYLQLIKKIVNSSLSAFGVGDSLKGWFVKR